MDFTEIIYDKDDVLESFRENFKVSHKDQYDVQNLLWLDQQLERAKTSEKHKEKLIKSLTEKIKPTNSRYRLVFGAALEYLNGVDSLEYRTIIEAISIIKEYAKRTMQYINEKRYVVTVPQISEMLDLSDNYISRNLIGLFDRFTICNTARYVIKLCYPDAYDVDFLNKKVFISRISFSNFLLKHLKYTVYRVQIDLNMPDDKYIELRKKFKSDKVYKAALKKVVAETNDTDKLLEEIKKEAGESKKITRNDLPVIDITKDTVEDIFGADLILKSVKTIKNEVQVIARSELDALGDMGKRYTHKSINDKQIYHYIDYNMTSIRFKFTGLSKYNKQLEKDEEKVMVKYVVDVNDMANIHVNQSIKGEEEYFYSLDLNVYNHLVAKASNEEEKKEIIIDYFYKRLMDDNFKVYERKIKK